MANTPQVQPNQDETTQEIEQGRAIQPRVDIFENSERYLIRADLPGVTQKDVTINVDRGELTIEAKRGPGIQANALLREITVANYRRRFRIPEALETSKVEASLEAGVLTLELPKSPESKPRRIAIRGG